MLIYVLTDALTLIEQWSDDESMLNLIKFDDLMKFDALMSYNSVAININGQMSNRYCLYNLPTNKVSYIKSALFRTGACFASKLSIY